MSVWEFDEHLCSVCGTDCQECSERIDELADKVQKQRESLSELSELLNDAVNKWAGDEWEARTIYALAKAKELL